MENDAKRELEALREQVRGIASTLPDVVWSVEIPSHRVVYVSPAAEAVFGKSAEDLRRGFSEWSNLIHPDDRERVLATWDVATRGAKIEADYRVITPQGAVRWIETRGQSVLDAAGRVVRIDGIARDTTERRSQERRIAHLSRIRAVLSGVKTSIGGARDRHQLLHEACRIAVEPGGFELVWVGLVDREAGKVRAVASRGFDVGIDLDFDLPKDGSEVRANTAYRALLEKRACFSNDIASEPRPTRIRQAALEMGYRSAISLPLMVAGEVVGVMFMYTRERDFFNEDEVRLLADLGADISLALENIFKGEKLRYLAHYDELTGLPNRALFLEHLQKSLNAAREAGATTAVAVGNIRRLQMVNDSFGWSAGDALLRQFAQRIRTQWPEPEQLARISGDTFALILPNLGDAVSIAATIENAVARATESPVVVDGREIRIAMAVGATVCPPDALQAEILLRNAEAALKKAKASGERVMFYLPEMNARVTETLALENKLRSALGNGEFELHYQPKIDAATGRIVGLEALMRWRDPASGLVPPSKFIPILEETGMILEVGAWAIRKALLDSHDWRRAHDGGLCVAVNVSPLQLKQRDFVATVRRAIDGLSVARDELELEITESMAMDEVEENVKKLQEIRDMGVGIAVDDFGTGYSSLAYLTKLPVNALKIDRSFIATMSSDAQSMTLVSTIISLAQALKLEVVAEGVETEEQAKFLRLLRCDALQGYLYGRPMPAAEVEAFLRSGSQAPGPHNPR
jgi:diguanylate cyclase (GGDEF)-like protein/PAS domain S-box-containing protein